MWLLLICLMVDGLSLPIGLIAQDREKEQNRDWTSWRGPLGTGAHPDANPPVSWSETENIRWKVALPGKGHSTPIVAGDHVFITTAVPVGEAMPPRQAGVEGEHDNAPITHRQEFRVLGLNRLDGKILFETRVKSAIPHEGAHLTAGLASASPVTDGEHLYAYFGSYGLYCLDFSGKIVWQKDFGLMHTKHGHGEGSSPLLHGDTLVINWDHEGASFVVALNKTTGEEIWQADREEVTSWASPIVVDQDGQTQLIIAGTNRVRGYDLATGEVIWSCGGLSNNIVATPVAGNGIVIVGSSYEIRSMIAIRLAGAKGDVTQTDQVVWRRTQRTPYVPSMLLYKDSVYFLTHYQGILSRVNVTTGAEEFGPIRLDRFREIYASPVAAADRIYITDREGKTIVISHAEIPRAISLNQLEEPISASLALAGDEIFIRGEQHLYCIAEVAE
jgi:outer membrane protein assembly factor BamB